MAKVTVLISAGGTGGHVIPALNLGKFLRDNGINVIFVGRKNSFEEKIYKKNFFKIEYIDVGAIKGRKFMDILKNILKLFKSLTNSIKILSTYKPEIVIGFGGFVSFPLVLCAKLLKFKTAICEQNAVMGLANRILAQISDKVFLNFKNTQKVPLFADKEVIGNFVKKEILEIKDRSKKAILIFGGSQGAEKLNEIIIKISKKLQEFGKKIIHITGEKNFEKVKNEYEKMNLTNIKVIPFTENMEDYYKEAEIVISRAGATTISELNALNLKSIIIPYPYSADDHQWYNACEYMKTGKCAVIIQDYLTENRLLKWIEFFINNEYRFESKREVLGNPQYSYKKIYKWIEENV